MLDYPLTSPLFVLVLGLYYFVSAITTYDTRLIQAERANQSYGVRLPSWTGIFSIIYWGLLITLFVLNWKLAIAAKIIQFILKLLPVLEIIGGFIMSPFLVPAENTPKHKG